jgi:SulP family sulfate permease
MVVTTTTAAALAVGSALSGFTGADGSEALFVLSALAGVMMIAAACCAGVASHGLSRSRC